MKPALAPALLACFFLLGGLLPAAPISATDADGRPVVLNAPGKVTAVISSSPETQDQTRAAGRVLDVYRGRADFQLVIVVDLRGSFAGIVPGIVKGRMRDELDKEAVRLTPAYRANGNAKNPRPDMESVPDFDGTVSKPLGWAETPGKLRVVLFGPDGIKIAHWDDLKPADYPKLHAAATRALGL